MNIILLDKDELDGTHLHLSDHRAKHIVKVLRSEPGDRVRIGVVNGAIGYGTILQITKKYPFQVVLAVTLGEKRTNIPPIDLLIALPRPIMLRRILSQVTALGVGKIMITNARRVEKSFWAAGIVEELEYRQHLLQGLEQAVDTRVPEVSVHKYFRPFLEGAFAEQASSYSHLLLAHPEADKSLSQCMNSERGRILYAIGPEGGWVDFELDTFQKAGMQLFSMGSRILKVDTAAVAVHSRILQELER